ncbi:hypothetical protein B0H12DRAFT_57474 [Mycena haematopus]|nr:hypothetical protein B0H12DRAFT_57474 [Mycena haematopus]
MPSLAIVEASNAAFCPNYVPVVVVVGGTSGVGQAMAEALARQTKGHAHIILVGRNATAAARILASFPKPTTSEADGGWAHEFVQCDASNMASVRLVCAGLRARLERINFLILTAGGVAGNSLVYSSVTPEGLDACLVMRYFMRYLFTKELLPLIERAQEMGQHAHVMTVLGAGFGMHARTTDLGLHEARARSIKFLRGVVPSVAAIKAIMAGVAYNDALVAHFAALHPSVAFTHIGPGQVLTEGGSFVPLGWALAPLAWVLGYVKRAVSVTQDECAQYMIYALLDPASDRGGLYIRWINGDVVSARVFDPDHDSKNHTSLESDTAQKFGVLKGVPMKGYGGSDASVAALIAYTEQVLAAIP